MRRIAALILVGGAPASARAQPVDDVETTTIACHDIGRVGIGPLIGAGLGDGGRRDRATGVRAVAFPTDDVGLGAELRELDAGPSPRALALVTGALDRARTRAASIDVGYRIATARASGLSFATLDLFASVGGGAVWTSDDAHAAATAAITARVRLAERIELELGVHEDLYEGGGDLEARASLTFLWPAAMSTHCEYRRGRRMLLDHQPALRL